jgi:uncharacterized protein
VANRLAAETSLYLLQHASNPVDWYPWGPEAFERARRENKPVFLSIGYSACHWCHVMERESFTNPDTAALLNAHFVSVKVDREERPDLDAIYMQAVTTLTGRGGWPLSVWLTPDGEPFYGGTYFPPYPRFGMPSFGQVLETLADIWLRRRDDLKDAALRLREVLGAEDEARDPARPRQQILVAATKNLETSFDPLNGGWGEAPKFPQPLVLDYLLQRQALCYQPQIQVAIDLALDGMASGGIFDHLGGGFHRYSTDEHWLVPHFEKMLYDNAQLARCYLHAWQVTGKSLYREVSEATLDYLLRDLRHPSGAFFSSEDADSEGREGAFYVWSFAELCDALSPEETDVIVSTFGVTPEGNFEGANVLHVVEHGSADQVRLDQAKQKLLQRRGNRQRPARDEKVVAGWNGLALTAFAEAARALRSDRYTQAASGVAEFLVDELITEEDRLAHVYQGGQRVGNGLLDDYAAAAEGFLALYQCTFDERWFLAARALADSMVRHFDRAGGGFYDTSDDHERLIIRPRSLQDSPTPSGNSLAATVLLRLAAFTGEERYWSLAEETLMATAAQVERAPTMFGQWLSASLLAEAGFSEVAVVGDIGSASAQALLSVAASGFRPTFVTAAGPNDVSSAIPMLKDREPAPEHRTATAWVCHQSTCLPPTTDPDRLRELLEDRS